MFGLFIYLFAALQRVARYQTCHCEYPCNRATVSCGIFWDFITGMGSGVHEGSFIGQFKRKPSDHRPGNNGSDFSMLMVIIWTSELNLFGTDTIVWNVGCQGVLWAAGCWIMH